ncbi:MAG: DUF4292 domain-containing protein [Bacteroidales bacterium]|nr:DUF4292 domain-containing protein [Bacteroidales bacterium]
MKNQLHRSAFEFLLLILLSTALVSCGSSKLKLKEPSTSNQLVELFEQVPHFKTLRSQIQINANGMSAKGDLRIIRNQAVYLSVQAFLGIEIARLKITPDSMIAIDRLHRRYFSDSFAHIYEFNNSGINYNTIQSLFSNTLFILGKDSLKKTDIDQFKFDKKDKQLILTSRKGANTQFVLNENRQLKQTVLVGGVSELKLLWSYSDFSDRGFPKTMQIEMSSSKRKIGSALEFAKMEFDKPLQVECPIPSRYSKVDLNEILKIFSNL